MTEEDVALTKEWRSQGMSIALVAGKLRMAEDTVRKHLAKR